MWSHIFSSTPQISGWCSLPAVMPNITQIPWHLPKTQIPISAVESSQPRTFQELPWIKGTPSPRVTPHPQNRSSGHSLPGHCRKVEGEGAWYKGHATFSTFGQFHLHFRSPPLGLFVSFVAILLPKFGFSMLKCILYYNFPQKCFRKHKKD